MPWALWPAGAPAVTSGHYVYVSAQSALSPTGQIPETSEAQAQQALENLKAVLTSSGLSLKNVVYTQVYLKDASEVDAFNRVFVKYFSDRPPAGAILGVADLPDGSPLALNAIAAKDASEIQVVSVRGRTSGEPFSAGILTNDSLFISATPARPSAPETEVKDALDGMKSILEAAHLTLANIVFVNPFLTMQLPTKVMNRLYAQRFEFGNTPGRATIEVSALPNKSQIEFTGIAVRDLKRRQAVRPKNMPPSPTASPCVFAGDVLYCSAKSGFIPGPNGGVFTPDIGLQLRQTMRNLLDNLEEAQLSYDDVVSTTIYLDNLADAAAVEKIYAKYFHGKLPASTIVQQLAPTSRDKKDGDDAYPEIEQISLIAVKHGNKAN